MPINTFTIQFTDDGDSEVHIFVAARTVARVQQIFDRAGVTLQPVGPRGANLVKFKVPMAVKK